MSKISNLISIEIFLTCMSFMAGIIIYISQYGFIQDIKLISFSILISLYLIYFPNFIKKNFEFFKINKWFSSLSFLHLFGMFTVFLGGIINEKLQINLFYFYSFFGIIFFILFIFISTNLKNISSKNFLFYIVIFTIFILFSIFITIIYYNNFYINPLIHEKIINGSWAHRDIFLHSAITGMIKTHGVTSIGLEGITIPHYYHTFSHRLYAAISSLLDTNSLNFYSTIYPIIVVPFFFQTFIYCTISFNNFFKSKIDDNKHIYNNLNYWILLFILFAVPFPINWIPDQYNFVTSQNYLLAIALSFSFFSILSTNKRFLIRKNFFLFNFDDFFFLFFCLIIFSCISLSKLSFLYFLIIIFLFFYFRYNLFLNLFHNLLLLFISIISLIIYFKIIIPINSIWDSHGAMKGSYFSELYSVSEKFYIYFYYSIFYIILRIYYLNIFSFKKFYKNLKDLKLIDIELLLVAGISLTLFPYIYSNGIQVFMAYVLITSNIRIIPLIRYKYND